MLWQDTERCFVYSGHQSWTTPECWQRMSRHQKIQSEYLSILLKQQLLNVHLSWPVDSLTKYLYSLSSQFVFPHTPEADCWHITGLIFYLKPRSRASAGAHHRCSKSLIYQRQIFLTVLADFLVENEFDLISFSWARGVSGNKVWPGPRVM